MQKKATSMQTSAKETSWYADLQTIRAHSPTYLLTIHPHDVDAQQLQHPLLLSLPLRHRAAEARAGRQGSRRLLTAGLPVWARVPVCVQALLHSPHASLLAHPLTHTLSHSLTPLTHTLSLTRAHKCCIDFLPHTLTSVAGR